MLLRGILREPRPGPFDMATALRSGREAMTLALLLALLMYGNARRGFGKILWISSRRSQSLTMTPLGLGVAPR